MLIKGLKLIGVCFLLLLCCIIGMFSIVRNLLYNSSPDSS